MKNLIIFAHTFWENSKANHALLKSIEDEKDIKIHNLSALCFNKDFDINTEISLLKNAEKIIFQFPLFWFSTPSVLKEWQDKVLSAILHGENPKLLEGKKFQIITTLGGIESSYDGHHGATLEELLKPIYYAFEYMGCKSIKPYAIFNAQNINLDYEEYKKQIKA